MREGTDSIKSQTVQIEEVKSCKYCNSEEIIEFWSPLNHEFRNVNTDREYRIFRFCNNCGRSEATDPITNEQIREYNKAISNGNKFMWVLLGGCMIGAFGLFYVAPKILEWLH